MFYNKQPFLLQLLQNGAFFQEALNQTVATTPASDSLNWDLHTIRADLPGCVLKQATLVEKILQSDPKDDVVKLFAEMFDTKKTS